MQKVFALMVLAAVVSLGGCSEKAPPPPVRPTGSPNLQSYLGDYKAAVYSYGKLVTIHNSLCHWVHFPEAVTAERRADMMEKYSQALDDMQMCLRSIATNVQDYEILEVRLKKPRQKIEAETWCPDPQEIPEFVPGKYLQNYWETERVEGRPIPTGAEKLRVEEELIRTAKQRVKELPWFRLPEHPRDSPLVKGL